MRLLSTQTLQFCEFPGNDVPEYAILSHTWGSDEISYQDMRNIRKHKSKQGFHKIYNFSQLALSDGYEYIWVDTCCIDKSSSAELQEAINSMYQWYRKSGHCYAFLSDVSMANHTVNRHGKSLSEAFLKSFGASRWFTRGWTLQEMLAPKNVTFVDGEWKKFGTARDLSKAISEVTGIEVQKSIQDTWLKTSRVARVMAWAANRQTTRIEDRAYSLLGLFDVHFPMLYGEGERAFQRLQEEILKVNDDASILAWSCTDTDADFAPNGLATSPAHFHKYPNLVRPMRGTQFVSLISTLTPRGLQATLRVQKDRMDSALGYAVLVDRKGQSSGNQLSLILPIMFPEIASSQSIAKNECVRFSDPVWVASDFVKQALPEEVCFTRHVQALRMNFKRGGFTLHSKVWAEYIPTFTYPIQTQAGNRHFPTILGGLSRKMTCDPPVYTFILELTARKQASKRFVVLVDYQLRNRNVVNVLTVTVINIRMKMYLRNAVRLAEYRKARKYYTPCDLFDGNGNAILTNDIVQVNEFKSCWVRAEDNDFDRPLPCPDREVLTRQLNIMTRSDEPVPAR